MLKCQREMILDGGEKLFFNDGVNGAGVFIRLRS